MISDLDRRAFDVMRAAFDRDTAERGRFVEEVCAGDAELLASVRALLARDPGERDEDSKSRADALAADLLSSSVPVLGPERIGKYVVVTEIGRGGMGVVYEALQENPRRAVAIKIVRALALSGSIVRRFEREAQILARLHHPSIAQIFEAGEADIGGERVPYLSMELVQGRELSSWNRDGRRSVRAKVELVAKIGDAVAHAHERGVVHRDLKPGNVLVDSEGRPKVLDFGIARLTDVDLQRPTMLTEAGLIVGTLAYMAPEQLDGDPSRLDARADVYALGAVLYELVSGRLPHVVDGLPLPRAIEAIRDEDPPPLGAFDRALRGDLETVVGKALERDPTRRYAGAAQFVDDLRRYLADEPISARPPSTIYQLQKFARRHRKVVGWAAATVLALTAGLIVSSVQYMRADRARTRVAAVNDFLLQRWLGSPDPAHMGRDVKVVDLLEHARVEAEDAFRGDPELLAETLHTLGTCSLRLGASGVAVEPLKRALALREEILGARAEPTLTTRLELARALTGIDELDRALPLWSEVREASRALFGPADPRTLDATAGLAETMQHIGRADEADVIVGEAIVAAERSLPHGHETTVRLRETHFYVLCGRGEFDEAERELARIRARIETRPTDHPDHLRAELSFGELRAAQGRSKEAIELLAATLKDHERVFGPDAALTSEVRATYAGALNTEARFAEAEPELRRAIAGFEAGYGPERRAVLSTKNELAVMLRRARRFPDAHALAIEVLDGLRRIPAVRGEQLARILNTLGAIQAAMGQLEPASESYEEGLSIAVQTLPPEHSQIATLRFNRADLLQRRREFARAERAFRELHELDARILGPEAQDTVSDLRRIAMCVQEQGRHDEAWLLALAVLERSPAVYGENSMTTWLVQSLVGRIALARGDLDEAHCRLLGAWNAFAASKRADLIADERLCDEIPKLYRARGEPELARAYEP